MHTVHTLSIPLLASKAKCDAPGGTDFNLSCTYSIVALGSLPAADHGMQLHLAG